MADPYREAVEAEHGGAELRPEEPLAVVAMGQHLAALLRAAQSGEVVEVLAMPGLAGAHRERQQEVAMAVVARGPLQRWMLVAARAARRRDRLMQ